MEFKTITEITEDQIKEKGVQALADRPNLSAQYGASGFSAAELKLRFDKLASYLAAKINEIVKAFSGMEAAQYIRICLDDYGVQHLGELVAAFLNGDFAEKIVRVAPSVSAEERITLQAALDALAQKISLVEEETKRYTDEKGETFATEIEASLKDDYELTLQLKNGKGRALSSTTVTFPSTKEYKESLDAIDKQVAANTAQISQNAGDIESLFAIARENNQFALLETEQAYTTRKTANGAEIFDEQYTAVTEIKGSTKRYENLIPYPYKTDSSGATNLYEIFDSNGTYISNGITFKNNNGVITANGTATGDGVWCRLSPRIKVNPSTKCFLSGCPSGGSTSTYYVHFNARDKNDTEISGAHANDTGNGVAFTSTESTTYCYIYIVIRKGTIINNIIFKPLLVEGETGTWTPPFSDLKHAFINSIKSTGRNLFDGDKCINECFKSNEDGTYTMTKTENWRFSDVCDVHIPKGATYYAVAEILETTTIADFVQIELSGKNGSIGTVPVMSDEFGRTATEDITSIGVFIDGKDEVGAFIKFKLHIGLIRGKDNIEPYKEDVYQLPETLELGEWDSFNPQTGEITRQTKRLRIDKITSGWGTLETSNGNEYCVENVANIPDDGYAIQAVCNVYKSKTREDMWVDATTPAVAASYGYIRFKDPSITTLEEFRAYVQSLADAGTPMIVDIKVAPTTEKIENAPKQYKVWKHGSETVIQGETDNSIYGAIPTIKNEYFTAVVGEEETNE